MSRCTLEINNFIAILSTYPGYGEFPGFHPSSLFEFLNNK